MSEESNLNDEAGQSTENAVSSNTNQTIHDPKRRLRILYAVCIALMAVIAYLCFVSWP